MLVSNSPVKNTKWLDRSVQEVYAMMKLHVRLSSKILTESGVWHQVINIRKLSQTYQVTYLMSPLIGGSLTYTETENFDPHHNMKIFLHKSKEKK